MTHWLYVSPHLDDAVLSCGGGIARHVASGNRVTVVTIFTAGGGEAEALYRERREEDRLAAARLGFETVHLGLRDAPFRSDRYRDFASILYSNPDADEALSAMQDAAVRLKRQIENTSPDRLLVPLGVGGHIDHKITFNACAALRPPCPVAYYEERPYAFVPGAIANRWLQLEPAATAVSSRSCWRFPTSWEELPFLENYLVHDPDPARCLERLREEADRLTPETRTAACWTWRAVPFVRTGRLLEPGDVDALVHGILAYRSQVGDLFVGAGDPLEGSGEGPIRRIFGHHAMASETTTWFEAEWLA